MGRSSQFARTTFPSNHLIPRGHAATTDEIIAQKQKEKKATEAAAKQGKGGKKNASKAVAKKGVGPKGKGGAKGSTTKVGFTCLPHHTTPPHITHLPTIPFLFPTLRTRAR